MAEHRWWMGNLVGQGTCAALTCAWIRASLQKNAALESMFELGQDSTASTQSQDLLTADTSKFAIYNLFGREGLNLTGETHGSLTTAIEAINGVNRLTGYIFLDFGETAELYEARLERRRLKQKTGETTARRHAIGFLRMGTPKGAAYQIFDANGGLWVCDGEQDFNKQALEILGTYGAKFAGDYSAYSLAIGSRKSKSCIII